MKKMLTLCLAIAMVFNASAMTTHAVDIGNQPIQATDTAQAEIDAIFTELNEMAAEVKMAEILASESKEAQEKLSAVKAQNKLRKEQLEARLDILGVNTIDPNDPTDIASLEEVMCSNASTRSASDPPDLGILADNYTVQQYTSNVTVNGTSYRYSYIYVTDDKGYNGLTQHDVICLMGEESASYANLLSYQFSFGLSAYLALFPGGWAANWCVGSLFSLHEDDVEDSNVIVTSDGDIYIMSLTSITQMMYIYVYLPDIGGWYLCGTKAPNISYLRQDTFAANVAGEIVEGYRSLPATASTGSGAWTYVGEYINGGTHVVDSIGSLDIPIYGGVYTRFTPDFAVFPAQLL